MAGIKVRGGQLLHGLWSHAERAILQGGRPPPPSARIGPGSLRNATRSQASKHAQSCAKPVQARSSNSYTDSAKRFAEDAFTAVFKSIQKPLPIDSAGAAQVRATLRSSPLRRGAQAGSGLVRSGHRARLMPNACVPSYAHTGEVGLQMAKAGRGFCNPTTFVVHAPLALRAAADELEDDLQKMHRSRAKVARNVGMRASTRRSGVAVPKSFKACADSSTKHLVNVKKEYVNELPLPLFEESTAKASQARRINGTFANSTVDTDSLVDSLDSLSVDNCFSYPSLPPEPTFITQLLIPLCPNLEGVLAMNNSLDRRDEESFESFLGRADTIYEDLTRHRLRRIVTIERAFDQEPLRAYRPRSWSQDMLVEFFSDSTNVSQICLIVDFPNCTAHDVSGMLHQTMSNDSARWFSTFLRERALTPASATSRSEASWIASPDASSTFTDVGDDLNRMGMASEVSMEHYAALHDQHNGFVYPTLVTHTDS